MRKNRFIQAKNIGKKTLLFCLLTLLSLATFATPTKDAADEAYKRGHYQQAIADYDSLIKVQPTAELYYNLGNAHFRTDNITQAILAYERALQLKPGDNDIRFNLEFARSKTIDKITPESELFFFSWYRSLIRLTSVDGWARFAVVSIAGARVYSRPRWLSLPMAVSPSSPMTLGMVTRVRLRALSSFSVYSGVTPMYCSTRFSISTAQGAAVVLP